MAVGLTETFTNRILRIFSGSGVVAPADATIELTSSTPTHEGVATALTPTVAPGYAPVVLPCDPTTWQFENVRTLVNRERIFFPAAIAGDWTIAPQGWQLKVEDEVYVFGHINDGRTVRQNDRFKFMPGALRMEIEPPNICDPFAQDILGVFQGTNITPLTSYYLHFGTKDPFTNDGNIGELVGNGYKPLMVSATASTMEVPLNGRARNLTQFEYPDMWETKVDIPGILGVKVSKTDGTDLLKGRVEDPVSLKEDDNLRMPMHGFEFFRPTE